jgi:ComF family protein
MRPISGGLCSGCGERIASPLLNSGTGCGLCQRAEPPFAKAVAYGSYDGKPRELIHLLKYEQVRSCTGVLGRLLAEAISGLTVGSEQVFVIPVPLHRRRVRQRGFNQAERIARDALQGLGSHHFLLQSRVLERCRETQSQIGLTRHQRRANMRGAFAVAEPEAVKARKILLVDDLFTTGTMVSECVRILRRAGASKVYVATVARTLKAETPLLGWPQDQQRQAMVAAG